MSSRNYVSVGKVEVKRPAPSGSRGMDMSDVVMVGVRSDTGELLVQVSPGGRVLPSLNGTEACQLAELLTRGAGMASGLREAYETYLAALRQAEDALKAATAVHGR